MDLRERTLVRVYASTFRRFTTSPTNRPAITTSEISRGSGVALVGVTVRVLDGDVCVNGSLEVVCSLVKGVMAAPKLPGSEPTGVPWSNQFRYG